MASKGKETRRVYTRQEERSKDPNAEVQTEKQGVLVQHMYRASYKHNVCGAE